MAGVTAENYARQEVGGPIQTRLPRIPIDSLCNWFYFPFCVVIWPDRLAATKKKQLKGRCFIRETLTLAGQGFFIPRR